MTTEHEETAADGAVRSARRLPKKRKWKSVQWLCFGLAFIPIVSFAVFNGVPVVISFISMFTNMENNDLTTMEWNSFQNFTEVFRDERFWNAWKTTFWLATAQLVTLLIALVISVLLERHGFLNYRLFVRMFRNAYGCSPSALRREASLAAADVPAQALRANSGLE